MIVTRLTTPIRLALCAGLGISIALLIELAPQGYAGSGAETCRGKRATIVDFANSEIIGTDGNDVIATGDGEDVVVGRGGADIICPGPQADDVRGGAGPDVGTGQKGNDLVRGGPGDDRLIGGRSGDSDQLRGNGGNEDRCDVTDGDAVAGCELLTAVEE
jgi:Ca2+-binding RTX toxin-like protein